MLDGYIVEQAMKENKIDFQCEGNEILCNVGEDKVRFSIPAEAVSVGQNSNEWIRNTMLGDVWDYFAEKINENENAHSIERYLSGKDERTEWFTKEICSLVQKAEKYLPEDRKGIFEFPDTLRQLFSEIEYASEKAIENHSDYIATDSGFTLKIYNEARNMSEQFDILSSIPRDISQTILENAQLSGIFMYEGMSAEKMEMCLNNPLLEDNITSIWYKNEVRKAFNDGLSVKDTEQMFDVPDLLPNDMSAIEKCLKDGMTQSDIELCKELLTELKESGIPGSDDFSYIIPKGIETGLYADQIRFCFDKNFTNEQRDIIVQLFGNGLSIYTAKKYITPESSKADLYELFAKCELDEELDPLE